jgi:hypothetical protein
VEGEDGRFYVCKFVDNPQGNRSLVNEWMAQSLMSMLGISTPPLRVLSLPETLRDEALCFEVGNKRVPIKGKLHLGSLCPVNPEIKTIFDFLPASFLKKVSNLDDFARVFVADRWLYQLDQRQAVFARDRAPGTGEITMQAHFIDHGMTFGGSSWQLRETVGHGLYMDREVYRMIDMGTICNETVSQIESLGQQQILSCLKTLPECWLSAGDADELPRLLTNLHRGRLRLRHSVKNQLVAMGITSGQHDALGMMRKGMGSAQSYPPASNACHGV